MSTFSFAVRVVSTAALFAVSLGSVARAAEPERPPASHGVPVFTYHKVDWRIPRDPIGDALTITPRQFASQLATLAEHHLRTISAADLVASLRHGHLPERAVVLTFDDGYKDDVTEALPLLRRYHDTATFYLISGTIDSPRHLTWADVRTLRDAGMEIGAHGAEHVDLRDLSAPGQAAQVRDCMLSLMRRANVDPATYAYPSGQFNATTLAVMRRAHVGAAFTMQPGFVHDLSNPYRLPRIRVMRTSAVEAFREVTAGL
jgi:peptidoglycan/xylan/chitin deacetylase (PgdA/CDA1 family)